MLLPLQELCNDFEGYLMSMISDPLSAATIMLMTKMLSHHSADEEYLNSKQHPWITVSSCLPRLRPSLFTPFSLFLSVPRTCVLEPQGPRNRAASCGPA